MFEYIFHFELIQNGAADGARTRDNRNHNPGLYQLNYGRHKLLYLTGAPSRTRTCNPRLRRAMLYPVELRAQYVFKFKT